MLTGKLTRLRTYDMADRDNLVRWMNDLEVTHWLGARYPVSAASEDEWLQRVMKRATGEEITLAIDTLAEARHIGSISLHEIHAIDRHASLGIVIGEKDCWGRGYGTDAMLALLRYAFDDLNLNRVELQVLSENPRAIASYRKCGFVAEGELRQDYYQEGRYFDLTVMGVLAEEFRTLYGGGALERSV